jgi:hypothetical protein
MRLSLIGRAAAALASLCLLATPAAAAPGITADLTAGVAGAYAGSNATGLVPTFPLSLTGLVRLAPGTAAGQADKMFADYRTIAASGADNLDLAGTLTDPLGATLTCAKVKAMLFIADPTNTNDLLIGPGTTNPFNGPFAGTTPTVAVRPGGVFLIAHPGAGWVVTASTGDTLKVANGGAGTSVGYKVAILCTSV